MEVSVWHGRKERGHRMSASSQPFVPPTRQFLSPEEFSRLCGLSLATIRRYVSTGKLPFRQPGGPRSRILIPVNALAMILAEEPNLSSATDTQTETPSLQTATEPEQLSGRRPRWKVQAGL